MSSLWEVLRCCVQGPGSIWELMPQSFNAGNWSVLGLCLKCKHKSSDFSVLTHASAKLPHKQNTSGAWLMENISLWLKEVCGLSDSINFHWSDSEPSAQALLQRGGVEVGPLSRWPGKSSVGSMGLRVGAHVTSVSNRPEESLDTTLHTPEASETPGHVECSAPQCLLVPDRGSVGRLPCPGALCVCVAQYNGHILVPLRRSSGIVLNSSFKVQRKWEGLSLGVSRTQIFGKSKTLGQVQ